MPRPPAAPAGGFHGVRRVVQQIRRRRPDVLPHQPRGRSASTRASSAAVSALTRNLLRLSASARISTAQAVCNTARTRHQGNATSTVAGLRHNHPSQYRTTSPVPSQGVAAHRPHVRVPRPPWRDTHRVLPSSQSLQIRVNVALSQPSLVFLEILSCAGCVAW